MRRDQLVRLMLGLAFLYGSYELFDAAADELSKLLGELYAETVISAGNIDEGTENAD